MGGKAAIFIVIGFSLIFLVYGSNFNRLTLSAVDNAVAYHNRTMARYLASSGANMAANKIFDNKEWGIGFSDLKMDDGIINVYVSNPYYTPVGGGNKVTICHIPPGNPAAKHDITISQNAVAAHLAHGDHLGGCSDSVETDLITIVAEGTYNDSTEVIVVELKPSNFAKFGNFYNNVTAMPATGDVFDGPFHTQGNLKTYGSPVFNGKTSCSGSLKMYGNPKDPTFLGGLSEGVNIPMSFDTTGFRQNAGKVFRDTTGTNKNIDVRLYFNSDGTVDWSQKIGNGSWSTSVNSTIEDLSPSGLIYVERGNIYTKGTVNGKVTLVATKAGKNGSGNVYQEDDLLYADDPQTTNSDDVLGIVAEEKIRIVYSNDTKAKDIVTQASMFSFNQSIGPDDDLVQQPTLHSWKILGGLIANTTRVTAEYSGSNPTNGLKLIHTFDSRFSVTLVPPFFPPTDKFEVVSWYE